MVRTRVVVSTLIGVFVACEPRAPGPVVTAPSELPSWAVAAPPRAPSTIPGVPVACDQPWNLGVIGGDGQVVVVCANDVRRQALDEASPAARALSPALDPTRERVCACVGRLRAPAFVDLVFMATPEEGRVTVRASTDEDLDPELGPAFVTCIGTVTVAFASLSSEACSDKTKGSFIYPVRLELGP
ncbi:MAG: hypothetical protein M3O46_20090 [Myxococcota bacterium]|nr:hypothetical protein [Myxococcota bacterium]